jgi:hypothetical protein
MRDECTEILPLPLPHLKFSLEFSARVARTDSQLLLLDGKEDDSDEGPGYTHLP